MTEGSSRISIYNRAARRRVMTFNMAADFFDVRGDNAYPCDKWAPSKAYLVDRARVAHRLVGQWSTGRRRRAPRRRFDARHYQNLESLSL
jgi:hypothetical protein